MVPYSIERKICRISLFYERDVRYFANYIVGLSITYFEKFVSTLLISKSSKKNRPGNFGLDTSHALSPLTRGLDISVKM